MTASQRPERVDRDALIEAAAHALHDLEHTNLSCTEPDCWAESPGWERAIYRGEASAVLDAILPLIADAITARAEFWGYPGDLALADAARLVRSLGDEQ